MYTIVPPKLKEACQSRPDWPEFEKLMKQAWGDDWQLVTYEEAAAMNEAKPDTPSR